MPLTSLGFSPRLALALAATWALPILAAAQVSLGNNWEVQFPPDGPNGGLDAASPFGSTLVVAGSFTYAGNVAARNIAAWDGQRWSPLGQGIDGYVHDLVSRDSLLFVAGKFTRVGDIPCTSFAAWNGRTWRCLGNAGFIEGQSLAIHQGELYAGALTPDSSVSSTGASLFKWNGSVWERSAVIGGAQITHLESAGERLWLQGAFHFGDALTGTNLAYFDHQGIHATGENSRSRGIASHQGQLFELAEKAVGLATLLLRRWTGPGWDTLPLPPELGYSIRMSADSGGVYLVGSDRQDGFYLARWRENSLRIEGFHHGHIFFGDWFLPTLRSVFGKPLTHMGYFIEKSADPAPGGVRLLYRTIASDPMARPMGQAWKLASSGQGLLAYGDFARLDDSTRFPFLSFKEEGAWSPLPPRTGWDPEDAPNLIRTLIRDGEGFYAGGDFDSVGAKRLKRVAHWDGSDWKALAEGYPGITTALLKRGGDVFLAGRGAPAGPSDPAFMDRAATARWDGTAWHPLGAGLKGEARCMVEHGGQLHVGGKDLRVGGAGASLAFARWTGQDWQALAAKVDSFPLVAIHQLASASHGLYSVAEIMVPTTNLAKTVLARWDGSAWSEVRDLGINPLLASDTAHLFVWGGWRIDSTQTEFMARWDGRTWLDLGDPRADIPFTQFDDMAVTGKYLYLAVSSGVGDNAFSFYRWNRQTGTWTADPSVGRNPPPFRPLYRLPSGLPVVRDRDGHVHDLRGRRLPVHAPR